MDAVVSELRKALEETKKDETSEAALAVAELNLSSLNESETWKFPINALSSEAMACLTDCSFRLLVNCRKFHRKSDLDALLRYKAARNADCETGFDFFEFLASEDLDASVLPECEQLLNAEEYACLLTAVVANIEKENARMSRLQSIKESPTEKSQAATPAPIRSFRYSVN
jgi:hypothetical protein